METLFKYMESSPGITFFVIYVIGYSACKMIEAIFTAHANSCKVKIAKLKTERTKNKEEK